MQPFQDKIPRAFWEKEILWIFPDCNIKEGEKSMAAYKDEERGTWYVSFIMRLDKKRKVKEIPLRKKH